MSRRVSLHVKHNMELAHRLFTQPGKCQQIHGHGMQVELEIQAEMEDGYAVDGYGVLDFGDIKKKFRGYIDATFDHHLHLNKDDPWASQLQVMTRDQGGTFNEDSFTDHLPGLVAWDGDPSTENFAQWIFEWAERAFSNDSVVVAKVVIWETGTNAVTYRGEGE